MGNCTFRGFGAATEAIKVITSNGGIMELYPPITAECVTNEFPGHGIFRSSDFFSQPLLHNEELLAGELYYLLPLNTCRGTRITKAGDMKPAGLANSSSNSASSTIMAPYRISVDSQGMMKRLESEGFPRSNRAGGVWKVKLVISAEQLSEILSEEESTEALIESVRTVAKCGNGMASSVASSDQWSLSSSWKASSEHLA